jgi:hypothetical protein
MNEELKRACIARACLSPEAQAAKDIARLRRFWKERGHAVKFWVEVVNMRSVLSETLPCVRSNLVNGLPLAEVVTVHVPANDDKPSDDAEAKAA